MTQDAIAANLAASSASESESDVVDAIRFQDFSLGKCCNLAIDLLEVQVKSLWHSSFTPPEYMYHHKQVRKLACAAPVHTERSPPAQRARSP
jgi:hypothetical protein